MIWPHFQDSQWQSSSVADMSKETVHLLAVTDPPLAVFTAMRYRVSRQGIVSERVVKNEAVDHDKAVICGDTEERRRGAFSWELASPLNPLKAQR